MDGGTEGKEGREVIDLASAPTPWHSKWDGGMQGREGKKGEVHNAAAPATLLKPVNPELHFFFPLSCLLVSSSISQPF